MDQMQIDGPLVDVNWLKKFLLHKDTVILNATLPKAVKVNSTVQEQTKIIPGARFFDIKHVFSDSSAQFPNTWPGERAFNHAAQDLGINQDSIIVVYDEHGIYSSARAWWMFRAMGHQNVAVLNGGLPAWIEAGFELEEKSTRSVPIGDFNGVYDPRFFKDHKDVLRGLDISEELVIDARAESRFRGLAEEPRKGLRSGHIPGSLNLPYNDLLENGKMIDLANIKRMLYSKFPKNKNITFSCGSGITACVLALGATVSGYQDISVYDGSWTEWGSVLSLPIEKK